MLPFATFEVFDHPRPPLRGRFLDRMRVTYRKRRKYIRFTPWFSLDEGVEVTPPQTEPPPYLPSLRGHGDGRGKG
jgi:hypothetical protein